MRPFFIVVAASLILGGCSSAPKSAEALIVSDEQAIALAQTITQEELKEHLFIYASDDFEGRETGTK